MLFHPPLYIHHYLSDLLLRMGFITLGRIEKEEIKRHCFRVFCLASFLKITSNKEKPSFFSLNEGRMTDYKAKMEREQNSTMMQNNLYRLQQCLKVWSMEDLSSESPVTLVKMQTPISNMLSLSL